MNIDLNKYKEFVQAVTSKQSDHQTDFVDRLYQLDEGVDGAKVNIPLLLCGAIGLGSETGELQEIVKKCVFQGKPLSEDTKFHMKRELGDILWYWVNACRALDLDPNDVVAENVTKLESRYPGGKFDAHYSENRREGDL
jgi:NTP pyrophosphatase (non-canonical NTP hydrolase)